MRVGLSVLMPLVGLGLASASALAQIDPSIWRTDVSKRSIELDELHLSVSKDEIRALDQPKFVSVEQAAQWLEPREPVIAVRQGERARAYPIRILLFHEIVNDSVAELPIAVTFCPLCNTGLVFDRRVKGQTLEFAVAGFLRKSDMVMYDRASESLWQQATGEALVGTYAGERLELLGGATTPFGAFREAHPDGLVLSIETDSRAPYGVSHYDGYEFGDRDKRAAALGSLDPKERALAILVGDEARAYSLSYLARWGTAEGKIAGRRYIVLYESSMLSAMDAEHLEDSRSIGSAAAYSPLVAGRRLKFRRDGEKIIDKQSGSTWNVLGRCLDGPLAGAQLEPIRSTVAFAFAWFEFYPQTRLMGFDLMPADVVPGRGEPLGPRPGAAPPGGRLLGRYFRGSPRPEP